MTTPNTDPKQLLDLYLTAVSEKIDNIVLTTLLIQALRYGRFKITWTKKDGTVTQRLVSCNPAFLPEHLRKEPTPEDNLKMALNVNAGLISAFDLDKQGWVKFYTDTVTAVECIS